MVRVFSVTSTLEYPWEQVSLAFFRKYQPTNPFVGHIEAYDITARAVDPTGTLRSTRIISKTGVLPKWGAAIISKPQAFVIEDASIDPASKVMETSSKNVTHTSIMFVQETQRMTVHPDNPNWTQITTEARVVSQMGWGLKARLETLGVSRFQKNYDKSRQALRYTIERLLPKRQAAAAPAE